MENSTANKKEDQIEIHSFSVRVSNAFKAKDIESLTLLYLELSEEENINKAKVECISLYSTCFDEIITIIKSKTDEKDMVFYAWHFLQLMTSYPLVKDLLVKEISLVALLIEFNDQLFDVEEKENSLKLISLNYILFLLGGAGDSFYDIVASAKVIPYLYNLLQDSDMNLEDQFFQPLLLSINLLLEGSVSCKKELYNLKFDVLIADKIQQRFNCNEELLEISNLTYQKLLLLRNDRQEFVEEFRKNFSTEAEKQIIYQEMKCSNKRCTLDDFTAVVLKRCARCKSSSYCSKECQKIHWKESHSKQCKAS